MFLRQKKKYKKAAVNLRLLLASRHVLRTVTFAGHDRWSSRCLTFNQSPTPDETSVDSPPAKAAQRYMQAQKSSIFVKK